MHPPTKWTDHSAVLQRAIHSATVVLGVATMACSSARRSESIAPASPTTASQVDTLGPDLRLRAIAPGVWVHTSIRTDSSGTAVASNGLLYARGTDVWLIDTAWDDEQTERILSWAERRGHPVRRAAITHWHDDRLGGIGALRRAGIPVGSVDLTRSLALAAGTGAPDSAFAATDSVHAAADGVELFYPGPGHTRDNIVVWLAAERVLFGGCLVRSGGARSLGNTADADVAGWPSAIASLVHRYPTASFVVPGHGAPGDARLLDHTLGLLATADTMSR